MKANFPAHRIPRKMAGLALAASLSLVAACSERPTPPPAPTPSPAPAPRPAPVAPTPHVDWRQAPITPGDWRWGMEGGQSVARFAGGELVLRCDARGTSVTLLRSGRGPGGAVPVTVQTSKLDRQLTGRAQDGGGVAVTLPVHDPLLDAMAFSRGRFAIEVSGQPTLYVPSWPEVSRVIEDCR